MINTSRASFANGETVLVTVPIADRSGKKRQGFSGVVRGYFGRCFYRVEMEDECAERNVLAHFDEMVAIDD